jgi:UDP-N-acetyl-D-mannosaminuronic acid dehydrogenase
MSFGRISIVGLGYIGLPTAAVLAVRGHEVVGVDLNAAAVEIVNSGKIHFTEPDLEVIVQAAVARGHLRAVGVPEPADAFIIAVPTPFKGDHEPDLSYVRAAALSIAPVLRPGNLVILESTSPVGTTAAMSAWLAEARPDLTFPQHAEDEADIDIAYCPERVLPGKIIQELVENDRIIGGLSDHSTRRASDLYGLFVKGSMLRTNARTAEMCKLVENSFRDVNIAFANELSVISAEQGIDVWELIQLANHHPRVNILQPGPGVGGHCIAVDPWFIVHSSPDNSRLIRTARQVNDAKPDFVIAEIMVLADRFKHPRVACLGLSFKADVDDLRESPAVGIVERLAEREGIEILVVEPHINTLPPRLENLKSVSLVNMAQAVQQADILVMLVNHRVFRSLDPAMLQNKLLVDTRGEWRGK